MDNDTKKRDQMFLKLYLKSHPGEVTDEEIDYFREHPDQIDEVTAPVNVHKLFLWWGALLGVALVALSKYLKFSIVYVLSEALREFAVDVVFEIGVALIGAAVTAYILGILLNQQQENASLWRAEIRKKIGESHDT
ncbi:MAG: hypothetical protein N839_0012635 [Desulfofustis sp. PB-SRB1]|nr:hypothetical protein [Desulfofustis sp. PB-SRB1]MBM1003245.1 hypothetical protein [Desulfofustis sp. PB-SRB1]HBH29836.1 hypothetical protein [Desulfofustis sp.]HBH31051.1 hypothetical protein [Desulfofustis sp.]